LTQTSAQKSVRGEKLHRPAVLLLPSTQNFALNVAGSKTVSKNRRASARTIAISRAEDVRAFALVSLLSGLGLVLILSAGAAWLSGP
jgi:hypothetical protein